MRIISGLVLCNIFTGIHISLFRSSYHSPMVNELVHAKKKNHILEFLLSIFSIFAGTQQVSAEAAWPFSSRNPITISIRFFSIITFKIISNPNCLVHAHDEAFKIFSEKQRRDLHTMIWVHIHFSQQLFES